MSHIIKIAGTCSKRKGERGEEGGGAKKGIDKLHRDKNDEVCGVEK